MQAGTLEVAENEILWWEEDSTATFYHYVTHADLCQLGCTLATLVGKAWYISWCVVT